jgi:hypothetical protein
MMGEMGDDGSVLPGSGESGKGSLTDFSTCLKLPHHDPSPPSFFWIVELLRAVATLTRAVAWERAGWLHVFGSGPSQPHYPIG